MFLCKQKKACLYFKMIFFNNFAFVFLILAKYINVTYKEVQNENEIKKNE